MKVGSWYQQTFPEKIIYFLVVKIQKNGGFAGIQVDYYNGGYKPHMKKSSVPNTAHNKILWQETDQVPSVVKEMIPSTNG
jgi:hypothetical protein